MNILCEYRCSNSCDSGYHLSGTSCTPNQCSCSNGNSATGSSCLTHNTEICSTCDAGYELSNNVCLRTISGLTYPDNCYGDSSNKDLPHRLTDTPAGLPDSTVWCRSQCGALGYIYAGVQFTNECYCGNSFGKYGKKPNSDCDMACEDTSGNKNCGGGSRNNVYLSTGLTACDSGYELSGTSCVNNVCTCLNGQAHTGAECPVAGAQGCESCDQGYTHNELSTGDECSPNQCTCDHGTEALGAACLIDNTEICSACDAGFKLEQQSCTVNTCDCSHGTGATGSDCPTHASLKCENCDDGYFLTADNECSRKQCVCPNGTPASGILCPNDGAEQCTVCSQGFHEANNTVVAKLISLVTRISDRCQENACTCANGVHTMAQC